MTLMQLVHPVEPLSTADLIRWTLRIYLRHLPSWLALAALTLIPLAVFNVVVDLWQAGLVDWERLNAAFAIPPQQSALLDPALLLQFIQLSISEIGAQLIVQLVQGVILGGVGAVLAATAFRGQTVSLLAGGRVALGERLTALVAGHGVALGALIALIIASAFGMLFCVGVLGFGAAAYMYLAWVPLMAPVMALERGPLARLLARAWYFGKKRVWVIFAAFLALWALGFCLSLPVGWIVDVLLGLLPSSDLLRVTGVQASVVIVQGMTLPLGAIFYTLLYEDARLRLDMPGGAAGDVADPPEGAITAADLPNLMGVALLALGLLFALFYVTMTASLALPIP